jgi:hypothetical protein
MSACLERVGYVNTMVVTKRDCGNASLCPAQLHWHYTDHDQQTRNTNEPTTPWGVIRDAAVDGSVLVVHRLLSLRDI